MHPAAIGAYRIERELGRGGMGEVYFGRDTRLDRPVAIKALPAHLAHDPDRLARFQREAKVLASLSHPNIGAIYGLEEDNAHQYLILEFVEGQTLADRLAKGAIPVDEALTFAKQVADALEVAHEKGIVHRDIKPANMMVTPDGVVKVLDFGLARTSDGAPSSSTGAAPDSPTMPMGSPTIPGAIMGSAGYMSPEQARGKAVDKRSDIFSFGCVLYEMLTGMMPFRGETVADAIGATLHKEADLNLLPPATPRRVRDLLANCLAKDRRNRLHDMGDARLELERALSDREWTSTSSAERTTRARPQRFALVAVAGAAILAAGWLVGRSFHAPAPRAAPQAFHVSAVIPQDPELGMVVGISPDARYVVYTASRPQDASSTRPPGLLVVRRLDRDETTLVEAAEGAMNAALSPDGRWIAFVAAKDAARSKLTLKKIALDDGRPSGTAETLCELPEGGWYAICWSSDREVVLAAGWQRTMLAVPASGGDPRVVLEEERSDDIDSWSDISPLVPGKSILASRWRLEGQAIRERIEVVDLATGTRTPLLSNAGSAQLLAGGYMIARRNQDTLIAARLNMDTLQVVGDPVTVWSGSTLTNFGFFISANGTLAMRPRSANVAGRRLAWLGEEGQPQPIDVPPRAYQLINISPDGGRVLVALEPAVDAELTSELWIQDLSRRTFSRIPTQGAPFESVWSRDGRRITYTSVAQNQFSLWDRPADASGEAVRIYTQTGVQAFPIPVEWSPDGNTLAMLVVDPTTSRSDVHMLRREEGGEWKATPYLSSPADEHAPLFSPDGKWLLFCSVESGRHELYAQRFKGGPADASGRVQVSTTGHSGKSWWSPDGKEIRYVDAEQQVMSVQVQTEPTFTASLPEPLYSLKDLEYQAFAWAPDGRLMVVLQAQRERTDRIDLVVNFAEEVRTRVGNPS